MRAIVITLFLSAIVFSAIIGGGAMAETAHAQAPPLPRPNNLVAVNLEAPGTVELTWDRVDGAPTYHVGWVAVPNLEATIAAGRPWHDVFTTVAFENPGEPRHVISHLVPGVEYWFIVGISQDRFTHPEQWSRWTGPLMLTPGPSVCPGEQVDLVDQADTVARLQQNAEAFEYTVGRRGGSLTFSTIGQPLTFNLAIANDASSVAVLGPVFDGLTEVSWLTNRVEPSLAESWSRSDDGLTWTFKIRDDVRWHDGEAFTARDVAFTFNRIIYNDDIRAASRASFTFRERDEDSGEWREERMTVTALDDLTVQFVLPTPFAPFLRSMGTSIYPAHILENHVDDGAFDDVWGIDTDPTEIIGTGPFMISHYSPDERIVLSRNPDYWLKDADGNALPYLDEIVQIIVPDLDTELDLFLEGIVDTHGVLGREYAELWNRQQSDGFTIHRRGPAFGSTFLALNMNPGTNPETGEPYLAPEKLKWFSNRQFRQAVAHSVDKDAIINDVQHGLAYPQWSQISPAAGDFHNPNVIRYGYDTDEANAILDSLGWVDTDGDGIREDDDGNPIVFDLVTSSGNSQGQKTGGIIHRGLQDIGIGAAYRFSEFGHLVSQLTSSYDWEAILIGFTGGPEPHQSISLWHSSGNLHLWHPEQETPATEWEAQIDDLYTKGKQELNHERRVDYYHQAQAIASENVPLIYTTHSERMTAVRNVFGNTTPTLYGLWDSRYLYRTDQ